MKKIVDRYDKQLISKLPRAVFPGRIEVIVSESDAQRAVRYLLGQPILGFDTETRPSFTRGNQHTVALLQVSSEEVCFLFRLNRIGLPDCLLDLIADRTVTKVGLSWHDDLRALSHRRQFQTGTFIELQDISKDMGIVDMSLQKLFANMFGQKISKTQQLSNWEADNLSDAQKVYAATDAWACIRLFEEMKRMQEEGFQLEHIPMPEQQTPDSSPEPSPEQLQKKADGKQRKARRPRKELTPEDEAIREKRRRRAERSEYFRRQARAKRVKKEGKAKQTKGGNENK